MFCIKCGTKLPDNSKYCSSCGTNLENISNENISKNGKCLLKIERKKVFSGMAIKINIYLDGSLIKKISHGEKYTLVINNGKHNIYCEGGMVKSQSYEFIGDDNEISYFVSYTGFAQNMVNNFGIDLIKVNETQPGTYKG